MQKLNQMKRRNKRDREMLKISQFGHTLIQFKLRLRPVAGASFLCGEDETCTQRNDRLLFVYYGLHTM